MMRYAEWAKLNEKKETQSYDKGCVMVFFNFPQMKELHDMINKNDLYEEKDDNSYGLEDEPHCTVLYGLEPEVELSDVEKIVKEFKYGPLKLHNASLFENEKYDVLKFDVGYANEGEDKFLHDANSALKELPYESNFPDYHPHMTVAYLLPGKGKEYVEEFGEQEYEVWPTHLVFSQPDGTKTNIKVEVEKPEFPSNSEILATDDIGKKVKFLVKMYNDWNGEGGYKKPSKKSVLEFLQNNIEDLSNDEEIKEKLLKALSK